MLFRFCLYGFLKNQRYFEPFLMLVFLEQGLSFFEIGLLLAARDLTVNLLEIPSGAIADSFGRRGAMIVSLVTYIICFLVLASASSRWLFLLGMVLYGVGDTFRTGTHKSMIFEWLRLHGRTDERTAVYGFTRSWSQLGSALSGLIAAAFVLISGNYRYVFYFAVIPYVLNLINLASYPAELNGDHQKADSISESVRRLKQSVVNSLAKRPLRRLMVESMGWEGLFDAVKNYLQPILQTVAITAVAFFVSPSQSAPLRPESSLSALNETQTTALLIGPVYALLFLLSAWASRRADRLVQYSGGETAATRKLWTASLCVFVGIAIAGWWQLNLVLVIGFVAIHVLSNLWRPILITRFDSQSDAAEGATVLSIESQSKRFATMILAPALGWLIDWVRVHEIGGEFWPIGVAGAIIAVVMLATSDQTG
jgi:MFS family permease